MRYVFTIKPKMSGMRVILLIFFIFVAIISLNDATAIEYQDKDHTFKEILYDQGIVFSAHTTGYILTQYETIRTEGSFDNYEDNFFKFQFDGDNVNWNYFGHTYTGAQVYLYYRARSYSKAKSLLYSFLSSLWFELFIETYTEKPSIQDTLNTPIFGAGLGYFIEDYSVELINSGNKYKNYLGRILNPFSLLVDNKDISFFTIGEPNGTYFVSLRYSYD